MESSKPDRSLKLHAIFIALTAFVVLHALLLLAARTTAATPERIATVAPMLNVAAYLVYLAAGFIAGVSARVAPILHGIATGLLAAVIAIVFFGSTEGGLYGVAVLIANGIIFSGIGGACSLLLSQDARNDA